MAACVANLISMRDRMGKRSIDDCTRSSKSSPGPLVQGRGLWTVGTRSLKLVFISNRPSPLSYHTSSPCAIALKPMAGRECRFLVFSSRDQGLLLASDGRVHPVRLSSIILHPGTTMSCILQRAVHRGSRVDILQLSFFSRRMLSPMADPMHYLASPLRRSLTPAPQIASPKSSREIRLKKSSRRYFTGRLVVATHVAQQEVRSIAVCILRSQYRRSLVWLVQCVAGNHFSSAMRSCAGRKRFDTAREAGMLLLKE